MTPITIHDPVYGNVTFTEPLFIDQGAIGRRQRAKRVEWLSGACLLVRRRLVEKVGLLNEDSFFYLDDIDWGQRMGRLGIALHYLPWVRVLHDHGVTYRRVLKRFNTKWLEMLFDYVRRERGTIEAGLFRAFAVLGFLIRFVYYGAADKYCAVATCDFGQLLEHLRQCPA